MASKFVLFCDNVDDSGNVQNSWDTQPTVEDLVAALTPYYDLEKSKDLAVELDSTGEVSLQDASSTVFRLEKID